MDITAQMTEDIYIADKFNHPVYACSTAGEIPQAKNILAKVNEVLSGDAKQRRCCNMPNFVNQN